MSKSRKEEDRRPADEEAIPTASYGDTGVGPGATIGHYKLLSILGEGGYGIVYLAEQQRPIKRRVALKVIKPGMDSKQVVARFEAERQALALLDHPNIAHVFNAGTTEAGRPYFAMEYVKGVPITEHCDQHKLTIEQRLQLFLAVCEAVQHAHQKAIIHRDIKPSNILVSLERDKAMPIVIDFGVAKALSQSLTERTLITERGQMIGTPEYMSPEQANLTPQDIDTRSDVYSLGVVLYELLTGTLPFDPQSLRSGGIEGIRKVICEQDPATPSTRLGRTAEAETDEVAHRRRVDARTLRNMLRGDLDWITFKAMEKDRTRRYASVDAMAADIRNHLTHQPVVAAPPDIVYRFRKFARRHRQMIGAAILLLVSLLVIAWAVRAQVRGSRQRLYAEALEHDRMLTQAQEAFDKRDFTAAQEAVESLLDSPQVGRSATLLNAQILLERQSIDAAITELESLIDLSDEIAGQAHSILATVYYQQASSSPGDKPELLERWQEHHAMAERLIGGTAQGSFLRASATSDVREKLQLLGRALEQDRSHYSSLRERAYIQLAQRDHINVLGDARRMTGIRPEDSQGYFLSATALRELGQFDDALADHETGIRLEPNDPALYLARWKTYTRMARHEEALADIRKCVELQPQDQLHPVRLCATLTALGRYSECDGAYTDYITRPELAGEFTSANMVGKLGKTLFAAQALKINTDYLAYGMPLYPPENPPHGAAYHTTYLAERMFEEASREGRRIVTQGSRPSWSPDGTKLLYSMGFYTTNAVAMLDLETGRTELLTIPGKDPEWSPDGRHIAFVKVRTLLPPQRLSGLGVETWQSGYVTTENDEVWIMNVESREMHRVAEGGCPHWGRKSGCLYYTSRLDATLYSISVDDSNARPRKVFRGWSLFPRVSPDERYVADNRFRELRIVELSSGQVVRRWLTPPRPRTGLFVHWAPNGRELSVCGWDGAEMGLWIYDMETATPVKIVNRAATTARWSGQERSRLAVAFGMPYTEIWMYDLEAGKPTVESFDSTQNDQEHCRWLIDLCNDMLAIDPEYVDYHYLRTDCSLWIADHRSAAFIEALDAALTPAYYSSWGRTFFNSLVFTSAPELHNRLAPMLSLTARKAVAKEPIYARVLAPMFYRSGYHEDASHIDSMCPPQQSGSGSYDKATSTYTLTGIGMDIWDAFDDFHYAYKTLEGNGSITARIDSIEQADIWSKAGVMIRNTLDADSENAMVLITPTGKVAFQNRHTETHQTNGIRTPDGAVTLPHWLRLTREGDRFIAEHSYDGAHWQPIIPGFDQSSVVEIPMNKTVYIGLAVTSHNATRTSKAQISNVTTTGQLVPPGPFDQSHDIRLEIPEN